MAGLCERFARGAGLIWLRGRVLDVRLPTFETRFPGTQGSGRWCVIGWGIAKLDRPDKDIEASVKKEFERLAGRYPFTFRHKRLGTTHSKVLVVDRSSVVHTSFNWLSFKDDPKRAFRDERGFLVSEPTMVDSLFTEWEARFQ